ncbi:hypothetical protein EZY14_002605 [Kordia sp. TARA_039_SRF]|nr:hypothetical protein EZY14_002605 [Kordia sp. TARA_039_SRF]
MIIFRTSSWKWDLTTQGLTLNENSDIFEPTQTKNFSFPITVKITSDIAEKLNLIYIDNSYQHESKIVGSLQIDNDVFDAYILINNIIGERIALTFFYGKETHPVFSKPLKKLNFQVVSALPNLKTYAKNQLLQSWPQASHQFVKVLREDLKTTTNYEKFEFFLNNYVYDSNTDTWNFLENTTETVDGSPVIFNRNIMCPMTYLLEVLRVGFAEMGLQMLGDFPNSDFIKKILIVPTQFFEQYAASQYVNYSFANYTTQETIDGQTINAYTRVHTPLATGSYSIKIKIIFDNVMAQYFSLKITQNNEELYSVITSNVDVNLDHTLDINILDDTVFHDIIVELKLVQQSDSIAQFNNFTYQYKEGALNIFPLNYTLADYMPNITFKKLIDRLKTLFPLKFDYTDNTVTINFIESFIEEMTFKNQTHLENPNKKRVPNNTRVFELSYPDDEEILINKNGISFSNESNSSNKEELDIECLPLKVKQNHGNITAVYPEDENDLMLILYNGPQFGNNIAVNNINNQSFELNSIYNYYWKYWLKIRCNSETYTDSYSIHYTESIDLKSGIFKYNKNHMIKSLKKKRESKEYWRVDMETETL